VLLDLDATPATRDAAGLPAARCGRVTLVTRRDAIARDAPLIVAQGTPHRLAAAGGVLLPCHMTEGFEAGAVARSNVPTGAPADPLAGVDPFTCAAPRIPCDALAAPLRAAGLAVRAVGDALAPRRRRSAVREGQAAGEAT
jgi:hypothetical protein